MAVKNVVGSFVPTTNVWDVQQIYQIQSISPELRELLVRLYQNLNLMATNVNLKDTGYYPLSEFVNSQLFFPNPSLTSQTNTFPAYRQVFRATINFGALPNTGTKSVAHNLTFDTATTFTRIYGAASDTTDILYIPIPYASASGTDNIELNVDVTNVNITTASDRTNYNVTYVILEYIKS
jgi:hypothetical protein